jgi:hypothetical protein
MNATRVIMIATLTLLGTACTQQDVSSPPALSSPPVAAPATEAPTSLVTTSSTPRASDVTSPPATEATSPAVTVDDNPASAPPVAAEPEAAELPAPEPVAPSHPTDLPLAVDPVVASSPHSPADLVIAVPIAPCGPVGSIPADAQALESMSIDVDDDGAADTITSYFDGAWHLRLALSDGPTDEIEITGVGAGVARILGDAQVDWSIDDPATHVAELIVQAGANASGANLGVFGIDTHGCLFRFSDDAGDDLVVPIHAGIGALSGLLCDHIAGSGFLVELSALHTSGATYAATSTRLVRMGTSLVPGTVLDHVIDSEAQANWLGQFGQLTCGGTSLD